MEIILFTAVGIALYVLCDQLLALIERLHGNPLPYRNVIFFVMIFALAMTAFELINRAS
ncbi:MAG: hypothetical protein ACR2P1_11490 [Pseudomonadales bacterium]